MFHKEYFPDHSCRLCPRLALFLDKNRQAYPTFFNAPVPSFGDTEGSLLIVGLAPGLKGANQTGRPFTGDFAGILLYKTLADFGFTTGTYQANPNDGLCLKNVRITNAVRCVPPENKVTGDEMKTCGQFLIQEIRAMPRLKVILTLGSVAHGAVLGALCQKKSAFKFAHNAVHKIDPFVVVNSYHSSRYNANTGRLTPDMFLTMFKTVMTFL